jgi:hypothetical protein
MGAYNPTEQDIDLVLQRLVERGHVLIGDFDERFLL